MTPQLKQLITNFAITNDNLEQQQQQQQQQQQI